MFAQVSPALVSTPNLGLKVRIVANFTDDELAESDGLYESTSDLTFELIGRLLFLSANVVSVDTAPTGVPPVTILEVADERQLQAITDEVGALLGEVDARVAETVLEGVDVQITLGLSYLEHELGRIAPGAPAGRPRSVGRRIDSARRHLLERCTRYGRCRWMTAMADSDRPATAIRARAWRGLRRGGLRPQGNRRDRARCRFAAVDHGLLRDRQHVQPATVRAVVDDVEAKVKSELGRSPVRTEGIREQQWTLIDYGDVVVHVFLDSVREFYEIERLYMDAPRLEWELPTAELD